MGKRPANSKTNLTVGVSLATLAATMPAMAAEQAGVAASVQNQVTGTVEGNTRSVDTGAKVFQTESIKTGDEARTQILFLDETALTIGPNAEVTLDNFVFDPDTNTGSVALNTARGAFRFVTGNLSSASYQIEVPLATIGIRGTIGEWVIGDDGSMTLGCSQGELVVTLNIGGEEITLSIAPGEMISLSVVGGQVQVDGPKPQDAAFRAGMQPITEGAGIPTGDLPVIENYNFAEGVEPPQAIDPAILAATKSVVVEEAMESAAEGEGDE